VKQDFREAKYLNETGSKKGNWFLNRLDYFEFHQYPGFKKHLIGSFVLFILSVVMIIELMLNHFFISLIFCYLAYFSCLTLIILYPSKIIRFFKHREKKIDLNDFDSVASMHKNSGD
jgi:hypothetical protein